MSKIILTAESGSDLTPEIAAQYGIRIVPMHVSFGETEKDDGGFPAEEICAYYERSGKLPKTSGSVPEDFQKVFDAIHAEHPEAHILHLAYSAVTTISYHSALLAAEGRKYVTCLDTKHVSAAQAAIVTAVAEYSARTPEASPEQVLEAARDYSRRARMCFVPDDLEYLRAGGRISNVAYYLGGRFLHLHPRVEVLDGKLVATKKYRGNMEKVVANLVREYIEANHLKKDRLWLLHTVRTPERLIQVAEDTARACGYQNIIWLQAQGVITTHGGPGAIAVAGFAEA